MAIQFHNRAFYLFRYIHKHFIFKHWTFTVKLQGESKKSVISNQLEKPTGPYLTLSDLTGPYWALLGLTGPYWALLAYLLNLYTH